MKQSNWGHGPDSTGHKHGPESQQRRDMVSQVDRTVGYLRQRVRESGLEPRLNLIITSDHGMETVIKQDEIFLGAMSNFSFKDIQFELLDYGPNGLLVPKEGKLEQVYQALRDAHPRLHVFKKEEFPRRLHYADNPRITPLLMYGDPGYFNKGEHGFDNNATNMKTIFRAVGPAFEAGLQTEPFESVNVYPLLCELLGIVPEPHNGSLHVMMPMLRNPTTKHPRSHLPLLLRAPFHHPRFPPVPPPRSRGRHAWLQRYSSPAFEGSAQVPHDAGHPQLWHFLG
uniref:Ectonucleotide pyrophosphatase/phosphodiesterase 7 n=1 Tax=Crocodylus porosus TaxID=8502 RepID=A0A7M4FJK3_CROPO